MTFTSMSQFSVVGRYIFHSKDINCKTNKKSNNIQIRTNFKKFVNINVIILTAEVIKVTIDKVGSKVITCLINKFYYRNDFIHFS